MVSLLVGLPRFLFNFSRLDTVLVLAEIDFSIADPKLYVVLREKGWHSKGVPRKPLQDLPEVFGEILAGKHAHRSNPSTKGSAGYSSKNQGRGIRWENWFIEPIP